MHFEHNRLQISETEVQRFRNTGCLLLRDHLAPGDVESLIADLPAAIEDPLSLCVHERTQPDQLARIESYLHRPIWKSFVDSLIRPIAGQLLGEEAVLFKEKVNFKLPTGGPFRPHQDFPAYDWLPPRRHATCMVSMDEATPENGCLEFALTYQSDLHEAGLWPVGADDSRWISLPHVNGDEIESRWVEAMTWTQVPTGIRDLVFFDSHIPHRSGPNPSANPRRAAFLTFNAISEGEHRSKYYETKRSDPGNPRFHVGTPTDSDRTK